MRNTIILFLTLIVYGNNFAQERIYLDETGEEISKAKYLEKWHNKDSLFSAWQYIGEDGKSYTTLEKNLYLKVVLDYNILKNNLEIIINRKVPDSSIILLEYRYKDDLCTSAWDNNWTKSEIFQRKDFVSPYRNQLKKKNIFYIVLFEEGIVLKNSPNRKSEYFYTDKNNYFRELLFTHPTLCGSFALIKPNGQILIRNGEYRADGMAEHLKPENWNLFFETED
jgi:hypothetical protein